MLFRCFHLAMEALVHVFMVRNGNSFRTNRLVFSPQFLSFRTTFPAVAMALLKSN